MDPARSTSVDPQLLDVAYRQIVEHCVGIKPGDDVLILIDPERRGVGAGLLEAVQDAGGDPAVVVLPPSAQRGSEPTRAVAAAMRRTDAFLAPCLPSLSHTLARKEASAAGVRGATLPGVTIGMLSRLMTADLQLVGRRSAAVAELLTGSETATVRCADGTDLTLDLAGRDAISDDGNLRAPGAFGNLPCGEGFVSPQTADGTIAAHVLPTSGASDEPVLLTVEDGMLADATGGPAGAAEAFLGALDAHGPLARSIAELGIGTNENARITGNILEDEKVLGTAHLAFGASAGIGGDVAVPVHLDVVVRKPTVYVGQTLVVDSGVFVLDA
ncbi:MAG: aminopeptidase [Solirubrobacteraceae bacterium]|nr:aminopeptidase [Solirubrobacteraceae bacterium]